MIGLFPVYYFALGQLVYCLIGRRDWRFVLAEAGGQVGFICVAVCLITISAPLVRAITTAIAFWLLPLVVRIIVRRHPVEAARIAKGNQDDFVPIGIIDFSWIGMMAGSLGFIVFAQNSSPFIDALPGPGHSEAYYQIMADTLIALMGHVITAFFALGAVLTACMGILWAGEIWRSNRASDRIVYQGTTLAAAKMVYAFFLISLGVFIWIVWPLYYHLVMIMSVM